MAESKAAKKAPSSQVDIATIGGLILAVGGIMGGLLMEGGKVGDVTQVTSALIVLGGTLGAVMVSSPLSVVLGAAKQLSKAFFGDKPAVESTLEEIIEYAVLARKSGIVSLEQQAEAVRDPFLKKALNLAVDGIEVGRIREIMELEIAHFEKTAEAEAKVFEAAGGYAPTIGIIGAVLGLIQVMKNLANIDEVGRGIAVAFVATVYGVASANIVFLPIGNKLKARAHAVVHLREMILDGVLAIAEGLNHKLIRIKLEAYSHGAHKTPAKAAEAKGRAATAAAAEG
jgi:chemotaxis protein MotA